MSQQKDADLTRMLISESAELRKGLQVFRDINSKAHFISMVAAIEGARMRNLGTFSIVASQIADQAQKNPVLSDKLASLVERIEREAFDTIAVRNQELATDLIDKLDRNLFERNCDVQAWASFDVIKAAAVMSTPENSQAASQQLASLVATYVVYLDSFLLDLEGKIVSVARNQGKMGSTELNKEEYFLEAKKGSVFVTDLHFNPAVNAHTVCYCAPVFDEDKTILGVMINFFNWDYALEMIESGGFSEQTRALFINKDALVIGAKQKARILNDTCAWMRAGENAMEQFAGYSIEMARNGESLASGYCFTKGYNAYRGKGWSAIVSEFLGEVRPLHLGAIKNQKITSEGQVQALHDSDGSIESERTCQKLLGTMKEIDQLVYEINANNCEVKLLAVNASIQAGLAGVEGEGFSIIANDVAHLARQSLKFVEAVNHVTARLREAVEHSTHIRLVDAAKDTMSKVDRNLFERFCDIQAWSTFSKFQEALASNEPADSETFTLLDNVHRIYEVYHDIFILNRKGQLIATAKNRSLVGGDFSTTEWFSSALTGQVFFSDIYNSSTLKTPVITFSAPIFSPQNEIIGVIASKFNCNFLNDIIKATIAHSQSETHLINSQGQVIAAKKSEEVLHREFHEAKVLTNFQKGRSGQETATNDQKKTRTYMGYCFSNGYNTYSGQKWVVATTNSMSLATHSTQLTPAERFKQKVRRSA